MWTVRRSAATRPRRKTKGAVVTVVAAMARATIVTTPVLDAQTAIPERPVPAPARTWSHEFTNALVAQPIADGSIFVIDQSERMVLRLDARTGAARTVGRTGGGPLEYRQPQQLVRLRADTVAVYDGQLARLLYVAPDGAPLRAVPYASDVVSALRKPQVLFVAPGDTWYGLVLPPITPGQAFTLSDTMPLARMRGSSADRWDTLTTLVIAGQAGATPQMKEDGKLHIAIPMANMLPADDATVLPDGRVVVLRGAEYALEFFGADGTRGARVRVPGARYPLTVADRKRRSDELRAVMTSLIKVQLASAPANARIPEIVIDDPTAWPAQLPYTQRGMRAGDDGRLYVPVACQRIALSCVDVLDARGARLARYRLARGDRFLAAGRMAFYTVTKDEDDLQYVQLHRVP